MFVYATVQPAALLVPLAVIHINKSPASQVNPS
nr:MAG TPA: hypothetical protein [Bacteriophage sp.]